MVLTVLIATAFVGCQAPSDARLYDGLGDYHRPVQTSVALAKRYIDQGFDFLYGFDYWLARMSFSEAIRLDPNLVIGYWGLATAHGNTINSKAVPADSSKAAIEALENARARRSHGTQEENDLVDAAFLRFAPEGPKDRTKLDTAYSDAMRKLWKKYPNDPDVGALFAESILNLRPWNQWTHDGKPQPGTEEAMSTLQAVLRLNSRHPQGLHLWIHTMEGSPHPELALSEADRLEDLMPGVDHLQHMPAHIYNRTGHWTKAIDANVKSIALYHRLFWKQGETLDFAHARHSLAYAAAMRGQSELALHNASQIFDGLSDRTLNENGGGDYYAGMRTMFLLRFGRWKDVLAIPEPVPAYKFAATMRHEARAVAYAAEKNIPAAEAEAKRFETAKTAYDKSSDDDEDKSALEVAGHLMRGEILLAQQKLDSGIEELLKAVKSEDAMPYGEPPTWIQPTRHTLGAALLQAEKFADAERVYREDLALHPNNGWDLFGLSQAYVGLGRSRDAARAMNEFQAAWKDADIAIGSSCLCIVPKKG